MGGARAVAEAGTGGRGVERVWVGGMCEWVAGVGGAWCFPVASSQQPVSQGQCLDFLVQLPPGLMGDDGVDGGDGDGMTVGEWMLGSPVFLLLYCTSTYADCQTAEKLLEICSHSGSL